MGVEALCEKRKEASVIPEKGKEEVIKKGKALCPSVFRTVGNPLELKLLF